MPQGSVTVPVELTAKSFRDFALYDTLVRQRRWLPPAVFCLILCVSAGLCFALRDRSPTAGLLIGVLLAVGIGLPAVYFVSFFGSIRQQITRLGLDKPKLAYTVTLDDAGVHVDSGKERLDHTWESLYRAYRRPDAVYLYPSPKQAYLLPRTGEELDALWALLKDRLPGDKLFETKKLILKGA